MENKRIKNYIKSRMRQYSVLYYKFIKKIVIPVFILDLILFGLLIIDSVLLTELLANKYISVSYALLNIECTAINLNYINFYYNQLFRQNNYNVRLFRTVRVVKNHIDAK